MENTFTFEDQAITINEHCDVWVNGKLHYTADWQDGTLRDVKVEQIDIASYALYLTPTKDTLHTHAAQVDCYAFDNGSTKEFVQWIEGELANIFESTKVLTTHAEEQGCELPDPPVGQYNFVDNRLSLE
jgi:hypothetical protein